MPAESPPNLERLPPARAVGRLLRRRVPLARAVPPLAAAASPSLSLSPSLSVPFSLTVSGRASDRRATVRGARVSPLGRAGSRPAVLATPPPPPPALPRSSGGEEGAAESGQAESRSRRERGCGDRLSQRGPPRTANSVRGCGSDSAKRSTREAHHVLTIL